MTSKLPSFVESIRLKTHSAGQICHPLVVEIQEVRRTHGRIHGLKSLGSFFFFSVNLISCHQWSIFGGEKGPLLYFGFLVARLLSPRSPITQFELTLHVEGEPWPGATHCYNSSNTMKSNTTCTVTRTYAHT